MTEPASSAVSPAVGWGVLHLFCKPTPLVDAEAIVSAVKRAEADGDQVVPVAILGHKADLAFMALGTDLWQLRRLQADLTAAGLEVVDSYVSLTEISEYAQGRPRRRCARPGCTRSCRPRASRPGASTRCRSGATPEQNWFTLPYDERKELMHEHGASGRNFAGRILQVITGSTGLDDYEWGVTLFGQHPDDLKEVVYTMRFDRASATYAEFGPFYTGMVAPVDELLVRIGITAG